MSGKNPFNDLDAHQKLMEQMQKATDACLAVTDKAKEVLTAVEDHNEDGLSHPDIRREIAEGGTATTESVDERIQQHNESGTAHPDIQAKIQAAINDTTKVRQLIDELISAHNQSLTSHSDIREYLNEVKIQLGTNNLTEISQELTRIVETIDNQITQQIIDLQSVDAKHDSEILANAQEIDKLKQALENIEQDIITISNGEFLRQKDIDYLLLQQHATDTNDMLGYDQYAENGPNIINFSHTLPQYIGKKSTVNFHFTGVVGNEASNPIKYSVEVGQGDFQLSPTNNISDGQDVTMLVGENGEPGDIVWFTVTITDTVTNVSIKRVINTMIARPLDVARVSCYGLPAKVEPGHQYTFFIRNLADDGSGRYFYMIDPASSNLLFDRQTRLATGDVVTMTVPTSIDRDIDVTFYIVVQDIYSDEQQKPITVHTNPVPGAENFKHNIPAIGVPGRTYNIRFSGIVSANGTPAMYSIENNNDLLTFGKTENILANENVSMKISAAAVRGEELNFYVNSIDENQATLHLPEGVVINQLPESDQIVTTLPMETEGGVTLVMRVSGGKDNEGDAGVTYELSAEKSGFAFSKTTNISVTDNIFVTIPKVAESSVRSFNVTAVDTHGEKSALPKQIDILVKPIYIADTPVIISPQEGNEVPVDFVITWSEFSMHTDMQQASSAETTFTF